MKTVGIIGCGALGKILAHQVTAVLPEYYQISGVLARTQSHAEKLADSIGCKVYPSISPMLLDRQDYVVEAAGIGAVKEHAELVLCSGSDLIIVSVGALVDSLYRERLQRVAQMNKRKIYVVNGAIGGFDLMQGFSLMEPTSVTIQSVKAPESLNGAPYLDGRKLSETEEELVFSGGVTEAIQGFPKNVNVAVAASLAANAPDIQVQIKSVPGSTETSHAIQLQNSNARAEITIYTKSDPSNPQSSVSTAWSVIALLKNLASPFFSIKSILVPYFEQLYNNKED